MRRLVVTDLADQLGGQTPNEILSKNGAQSYAFLISMLPMIWERLTENKRFTEYSWLDVGPGAGFAANFLADMHSSWTLDYKLNLSTLDIISRYHKLMDFVGENIKENIKDDVYDLNSIFDYVSCSHVIEHVPNPEKFIFKLQALAKKRVFVLAPWKERPEILTKGHINIFDETFIEKLGGVNYKLLKSPAWGAFLDPPYEMLFLDLPGRAV
ncbi:methyltransferase domain-containing protein [Limnohabitans sp. INBF002]|uniref:methyltransferase domain-containing protein n=1 Tax=Limnohabitans sp. INBF002 TaxID=2986280 RepID=UPI002491614B|nr:methyltransferase domain-containing protein [Limnohabitans sp. INBF002]